MSDASRPVPAWEDPRRVLARHELRPKRGYSQNFLISRHAVEAIAAALEPAPGERVVELGPGVGTLTTALLRAGASVLALERDPDMLRVLRGELGHLASLELAPGDATELDLRALGVAGPVAVAGNLPYAITGAIFRRLIEQRALVGRAVVMVQREVRDRLLASPGTKAYGALTVFTRGAFEVRHVLHVPKGAFYPPPKVDSAVVRLAPRPDPIAVDDPALQAVVRCSFAARRKTLRNALSRIADADAVRAALDASEIDGGLRGETLSPEDHQRLARALSAARERSRPEERE